MPHLSSAGTPRQFEATTVRGGPGEVTIHLAGELDVATQAPFQEAMSGALEAPDARHVTLEASDLAFLDSSGLRPILALWEAVSEREGTLTVSSPQPIVRKVIDVSGVADRLGLA